MSTGTPVVVSRIQNRRGQQQQFNGFAYSVSGPNSLYPAGYPGIGGYDSYPNFTETNYPNVLMPGEIAFCTDSRRIYIGSINGEFTEFTTGSSIIPTDSLLFAPLVVQLSPASIWSPVLSPITPTPFFNVLYSVVDGYPTLLGTSFSKNGELQVTSTAMSATLVDSGTEINSTAFDINFKAEIVNGNIQIYYIHNFSTDLTFSVGTIVWSPI